VQSSARLDGEALGDALLATVIGRYGGPEQHGVPRGWLRRFRSLMATEPGLHGEYLKAMTDGEQALAEAIAHRGGSSLNGLGCRVLAAMVLGAERRGHALDRRRRAARRAVRRCPDGYATGRRRGTSMSSQPRLASVTELAAPENRNALRRAAVVLGAPLLVYLLLRAYVTSDAIALGLAGAIPFGYSIGLAFAKHRVDPVALISALGFVAACLVTVLANDNSLLLKLHEAVITFGVGIVLIAGVLVSRPLPVARLLRVVDAPNGLDRTPSLMISVFLILHALAHLALALSLPTSTYLVASRIVNWGSLAITAIGLSAYLRRFRKPA
jgi:intracellular septation protein A